MHRPQQRFARLSLALSLAALPHAASANVDPEDMKLIEAATCPELSKEYRDYVKAEKDVTEEIRNSSRSTTAANVIGIAAMAPLGIGLFTWNDNADAESNLAEIKVYREAIGATAKKKGCAL